MRERLMAVGEETLLTLSPLDLEMDLDADDEPDDDERTLVVIASSESEVAELEFIGEEGGQNIEDRVRQLQDYDDEHIVENELSLQFLCSYAPSVRPQQYHDTDIITVRSIRRPPPAESNRACIPSTPSIRHPNCRVCAYHANLPLGVGLMIRM